MEKDSISILALQELEKFQDDFNVPGLAFALFNESAIITEICLGNSTYGFPVNSETLFSIQSISKNITAMAALIAAEENIINLDAPISTYLPAFTVNSCFEENPQEHITIRMMLSHTAGFTHEAPIGNNFDYRAVDVEDHLNSISETWLKFPVNSSYFYSNLGYDLTTRIIANESGMSFNQYLKKNIFNPAGMDKTTVDDDEVIAIENRTEGTLKFLVPTHISIPLIGSGAIYTNLKDLVQYTQLHMNGGILADQRIISETSLSEMYKINRKNYGLGTHIGKKNEAYYLDHNGGGYGYTSTMIFYPEHKIGAVLLCNGNSSTFKVCQSMVNQYVNLQKLKMNSEITSFFDRLNSDYFSDPEKHNASVKVSCMGEDVFQNDWEKYIGTYSPIIPGYNLAWYTRLIVSLGYRPIKYKVYKKDKHLMFIDGNSETKLTEYREGLFFTDDGEAIDFTLDPPTYRNILLEKR